MTLAPKQRWFRSVRWSNALIILLAGPTMTLLFFGIGWVVNRPHPKDVPFLLMLWLVVGLAVGVFGVLCDLMYSWAKNVRREWFRFSLRTLFVAVTVFAVAGFLWRRADTLRRQSEEQMNQADMFWQVVDALNRLPTLNAKQESLRDQFQAKFEHHAELSEKYREAIWRPWVTVDDGLPPP